MHRILLQSTEEFAEKFFRQGMRVLVSGRIQTGSYTNKDGNKVYTTDIIVDEQEFADSKNASSDNSRTEPSNVVGDSFMDISDVVPDPDLPFN